MTWRSLLRLPDGTEVMSMLYPSESGELEALGAANRYKVRSRDGSEQFFGALSDVAEHLAQRGQVPGFERAEPGRT